MTGILWLGETVLKEKVPSARIENSLSPLYGGGVQTFQLSPRLFRQSGGGRNDADGKAEESICKRLTWVGMMNSGRQRHGKEHKRLYLIFIEYGT